MTSCTDGPIKFGKPKFLYCRKHTLKMAHLCVKLVGCDLAYAMSVLEERNHSLLFLVHLFQLPQPTAAHNLHNLVCQPLPDKRHLFQVLPGTSNAEEGAARLANCRLTRSRYLPESMSAAITSSLHHRILQVIGAGINIRTGSRLAPPPTHTHTQRPSAIKPS